MKTLGRVYLIGAGPGDPELITLKALRMLQGADAVVYDRLVSPEVLALAPAEARMVPVGKAPHHHPVPQPEINRILVALAREGLTVARLKGGDPFIFGRGSEEALELIAGGIPFEVAPGITAAQGCAAASGVPLTHRGLATGVRYLTGHCRRNEPLDADWSGLADPDTTLVVYMGAANIAEISAELCAHGLSPQTPVLAVCNGTTPREVRIMADLGSIPARVAEMRLSGPLLFVIGKVAGLYSGQPEHMVERLIQQAADRRAAVHA